ncbi:hypothetical protein SAMN05421803_12915 [Nocardiopsis flavescens]|uniref:Uncharacterized protein n=1 Tax=Nocardiopsis flavescens TaxID=758803 RepID=A0A1M6UPH5_9ACTN|nr:hypothetical protein [Nocardiopsis flavescens]SHK71105.1 hypothetical protein SAMN05421803_12915 [Nocardiopsis flavescens]
MESLHNVRLRWSATTVAFIVLVLLLARHECPPVAAARLEPVDLDLGGVQPQFRTLGVEVDGVQS